MENPELLLRKKIYSGYQLNAIQLTIDDLIDKLKESPGVWWNAYSQMYGIQVKEFPYPARNGFFIDAKERIATHRFISKGIARRDTLFEEEIINQLIPDKYKKNWFDYDDAIRCYSVLISNIYKLSKPIAVEEFALFNSWGHISPKDNFHHPRLIKPTWELIKNKYNIEFIPN